MGWVLVVLKNRTLAAVALAFIVAQALFPLSAHCEPGSVKDGRKLYLKYCYQCHGYEGKGDGPASMYQAARPRDFTEGLYKLKTSPPSSLIPRDEDIFSSITNGMPGSGMPRWENILSEKERWDLVAYLKSLSDAFDDEPNPPPLDYSGKIPYSPESVERGEWAYEEFKCYECHGPKGEGPAMKALKDDYGYRIWPRNLTKPWTYIGSSDPEAIYARLTNGIPLTPMPSFVKKGAEDTYMRKRWDVVNYVTFLIEEAEKKRLRLRIAMGIFSVIVVGAFMIYVWPVVRNYLGLKKG